MGMVEVVIKMPKEDYMFIKTMVENGYETPSSYYYNIASGIVLPKGHGDLKDVDEIERLWQKGDYDSLASAVIFAPTVIEADKAESEEV